MNLWNYGWLLMVVSRAKHVKIMLEENDVSHLRRQDVTTNLKDLANAKKIHETQVSIYNEILKKKINILSSQQIINNSLEKENKHKMHKLSQILNKRFY